jgi:predicted kinase
MGPGKTIRLVGHTPGQSARVGLTEPGSGDVKSPGQDGDVKSPLQESQIGGRSAGRRRIFLLSPANAAGARAKMILREAAAFPLAVRLREEGLALGEIFSFISGLYFRGKLAYARAHAAPPHGVPGIVVITASGGLVSPDRLFRLADLLGITNGDIAAGAPEYRLPLERDARLLFEHMGSESEVVLLGSVATPKYVEPLLEIFGERLMFPQEFVGRGDMSRGGLMLRYAAERRELTYVPVAGAVRHGVRPPKLEKIGKQERKIQSQSQSQSQSPHPLKPEGAAPKRERETGLARLKKSQKLHPFKKRKGAAPKDRRGAANENTPGSRMEAVILVGIQGAGKSTFYAERFSGTHARLNLDELKNRESEREFFEECLREGRSFVVDNTNMKVADRARYIAPARGAGYRVVGYFLEASLKDAMRRNNLRTGKAKVPVPAIAGALKRLEPMRKEEGFDQIFVAKSLDGAKFEVEETR